MKHQNFYIILVVIFIALLSYLLFSNQHSVEYAQELFSKDQYASSKNELTKAKSQINPEEYFLYLSYIERAEGKWQEADKSLSEAEKLSQVSADNFLMEIYLNQAFNAYLESDPKRMEEIIDKAKKVKNNGWIEFFEGLASCTNQQYERALERWASMQERPYLSQWMKVTFEKFFTQNWLLIHKAKCNISLGNYVGARQLLDQASKNSQMDDLNKIAFMLGYSYFMEGMQKPLATSAAYYKIAASYFNNLPFDQMDYSAERESMSKILTNSALKLVSQNNYNDLSIYIKILEMWNAQDFLLALKGIILEQLKTNLAKNEEFNIQAVSAALNLLVKDKAQRDEISDTFTNAARHYLQNNQLNNVMPYWDAAKIFSSQPSVVSKELSENAATIVMNSLANENSQLTETENYLGIWSALQKDPLERKVFATKLINWALNYVKKQKESEKAVNLIRLAFSLPSANEQQELADYLEKNLHESYAKALASKDPKLLLALLQTEIELNFTDIRPVSNLPDYLKLANNLFQQKKYQQALLWTQWVLLQDPVNLQALILAGLSNYELGNFTEAYAVLKEIPNTPQQIQEALFVSQMLSVTEYFKQNYTENTLNNLSEDGKFHLALGLINQNKARESLNVLDKIKTPSPQLYIAKAYAYYILEDWQNVLNNLNFVSSPYNQSDAIVFIKIKALIKQGNTQEAERQIALLEKSTNQNLSLHGVSGFEKFKNDRLDQFDKNLITAIFYRDVKQDYPRSLEYFARIKKPSNESEIERVVLLAKMRDYLTAKRTLREILNDPNLDIQKRLLPLLTHLNLELDLTLDALVSAQKYLTLFPENIDERSTLARLYQDYLRYDLAYEQLEIIKDHKLLTPQDKVDRIASLVYLNYSEEAENEAFLQLAIQPGLSRAQILRLGQLLAILGVGKTIQPTVDKVQNNLNNASFSEIQELIKFYLATGKIIEAKAIAVTKIDLLKTSPEGLLTLAELEYHLSNPNNALEWIKKAFSEAPFNRKIYHFYQKLENDSNFYANQVNRYTQLIKEFPRSMEFKLGYLQNAAKWNELNSKNLGFALEHAFDPHSLLQTIGSIEGDLKFLPELFYIKGRMLKLIGKEQEALDEFTKALLLSPSYYDAAVESAKLFAAKGNYYEAHLLMNNALYYHPQNVEGWVIMSEYEANLLDFADSIVSLEQAIKFQPLNAALRIKLSKMYLELENPEDARRVLEKGLEYEPNNIEALTLLLHILYDPAFTSASGDIDEIHAQQKQTFNKIQKVDPALAEKLLEEVRSMNVLDNRHR